jgi:F-type H+-transporting ATPase subunit b
MDPVVAIAAGGADHPLIDIDLTVLVQFGLFLVMFLVTNKLLFQPYLRLREKRAAGIEGARAEADRMAAEADAKLADYERQLGAARDRAAEEARKIRADASAHERDMTGKARAAATAALEQATARVRSETDAARAELMPQAQALSRQMVARLLGREVA